jgi:hypothetical protein
MGHERKIPFLLPEFFKDEINNIFHLQKYVFVQGIISAGIPTLSQQSLFTKCGVPHLSATWLSSPSVLPHS